MPKTQSIKKLSFINIRNFCLSKDTSKAMKRQATYWKKIFADQISDKELASNIYKEFLQLSNDT